MKPRRNYEDVETKMYWLYSLLNKRMPNVGYYAVVFLVMYIEWYYEVDFNTLNLGWYDEWENSSV